MRASVRRQVEIAVDAEVAWARVTDAAALHTWFPGITASPVEDDVRTITTGTGMALPERILTNDGLQRRFQYRIEGGIFTEHLGTIDVLDLGPGRCLVVYSSDAEPATMAVVLGGATLGALEELKQQLES